MPIPVYNYSMELSENLSLDYHDRDVLDELYPSNTKYFLDPEGNQNLPAGTYKIYYKTGAIMYNSDTGWNVNKQPKAAHSDYPTATFTKEISGSYGKEVCYFSDITNDYEVGFVACYSGGKELCTGNNTQYYDGGGHNGDANCVIGNLSYTDYTILHHTGGPIGIYFHATSPDISSSSSYSPTSATSSDDITGYGQPKFILVRTDDPADYGYPENNDNILPFTISHPCTKTIHLKRPGYNSPCHITINSIGSVNGKIRITTSRGTEIKAWTPIGAPTNFNTANLPDVGSSYLLSDEVITIEAGLVSGATDTKLDWNITVDYIGKPNVTEPSDFISPTGISEQVTNLIPISWTEVSNTVNGIVFGYDIYLKETTDEIGPWTFTDADIVDTVSQDITTYTLVTQSGKRYICGVRSITSNEVSDIITASETFKISGVAVSNLYIRIKPDNDKIRNQIKLQWSESSNTVKAFKIYRGLAYYSGSESIFDWVPIIEWNKTDDINDYSIVVDISKSSEESYVISHTGGVTEPTISTESFSGLTTQEIRNIQLKLEHYELWFKIEALSDMTVKGDLKYIVLGSCNKDDTNPATNAMVSCISTKTQFLDYLVTDPVYSGESPIKQELELIWVTGHIREVDGHFNNASRTAMDIKSSMYGREVSAWVSFRDYSGGAARFNLETGKIRQAYIKFNEGGFGYTPRGTVLNPVTGDCYCGGGDDSGGTHKIAQLKYNDTNPSYSITDLTVPDSSKFIALAPDVTRTYGSTLDKLGRIWYVDQQNRIGCVNPTGGGSYVGGHDMTPYWPWGGGYGICTDFYGNIWVTGWQYGGLLMFRINYNTGATNFTPLIIPTTPFHGGVSADIPDSNGYFNIWTGTYNNPILKKYKFLHTSDGNGNNSVSYISETDIDAGSLIGGGINFIHGTAFTSENDIICTSYRLPYILKVYQKENNDSWPNGGLFRFNDKLLVGGSKTEVIGGRFTAAPTGPRYINNPTHPMWHECYDSYDTNFSYTLSKLNRYQAWKRLTGLQSHSGNDIFGETMDNVTPFNDSWRTDYPLRMFPHYGGPGVGIDYTGNGYKVSCHTTSGFHIARFTYWTNAALVENPSVATYDLSSWALYVYSDFIGGVGMFSYGNYPVANDEYKFPPTIGSVV